MKSSKSITVAQFKWTAVRRRGPADFLSYDVWEWNVWKMKWVRLANTACGYGSAEDAAIYARQRTQEIQDMLDNNQTPPEPLR